VRPADSGRYPSGQRGQTVNLLAYAFGGSNPPLPTIVAGALEVGADRGWAEIGATARGARDSARETGTTAQVSAGEIGTTTRDAGLPALGVRFRALRMREVFVVLQSGGNSSAVERQPSKLGVAGSNPVSRSSSRVCAHVAQSAERVLGKDEVSGSIPDMGSRTDRRAEARTVNVIATANGRV
jgi:hypothetical protein